MPGVRPAAVKTALRRRAVGMLDPELGEWSAIAPEIRATVPPDVTSLDPDDYVPQPVVPGTGIDLREDAQVAVLRSWVGEHNDLFTALRNDPRINTQALGADHLHNGQYATPDAEVYAAMITRYRPQQIVEIGAGFSTSIARRTIDHIGLECRLVTVDPMPRAEVRDRADVVITSRIEDVDASALNLDDRTLLFVDSSHATRTGGDVPHIFCKLIPALPAGACVHVHDVFIPYDYPPAYRRRLYTEQYVLWTLLVHSTTYRMSFATHYMARTHPELMQQVFGPRVGVDPLYFGASLWFDVAPAGS